MILLLLNLLIGVGVWFLFFRYEPTRKYRRPLTYSVMIVAVAAWIYWDVGAFNEVKDTEKLREMKQELLLLLKSRPEPDVIQDYLEDAFAKKSSVPEYYAHIGDVAGQLHWYARAYEAYDKALSLARHPNQANLYRIAMVQTRFAEHQRLDAVTLQLIEDTLSIDPTNVVAINLLAIQAYESGDGLTAVQFWRDLLAKMDDPDLKRSLLQAIGKTLSQLPEADRDGTVITCELNLPANLPENATVFVSLHRQDAPMPWAAFRVKASELHTPVWFVEDSRLVPADRLSLGQAMEVRAHISLTDNPDRDARWRASPVSIAWDGQHHQLTLPLTEQGETYVSMQKERTHGR